MSQPPRHCRQSPPRQEAVAAWRRPRGVSPETWQYVQQRTIADHYDAFVAETPLCELDQRLVSEWLPPLSQDRAGEDPIASDAGDEQSRPVVIDLGTGTGRVAMTLAERGYRVIAIDLSQPMLECLTQRLQEIPEHRRVQPIRANLVELDCLSDGAADHAVCLFSTLGMIQGRAHRRSVLQHAARIVRRGGSLIVHVHHRWAAIGEPGGTKRLIQSWLASRVQADREFGDAVYPYRGLSQMFLHRFSRRELMDDLQQAGWMIQDFVPLSVDGSSPHPSTLSFWKIPGGFIVRASRE
ncbi:MAG: class I SAM-dependent methyltransferase [Planctomycetota bacterium]